jgi:hypothetical protein
MILQCTQCIDLVQLDNIRARTARARERGPPGAPAQIVTSSPGQSSLKVRALL